MSDFHHNDANFKATAEKNLQELRNFNPGEDCSYALRAELHDLSGAKGKGKVSEREHMVKEMLHDLNKEAPGANDLDIRTALNNELHHRRGSDKSHVQATRLEVESNASMAFSEATVINSSGNGKIYGMPANLNEVAATVPPNLNKLAEKYNAQIAPASRKTFVEVFNEQQSISPTFEEGGKLKADTVKANLHNGRIEFHPATLSF